MKKTQTEQKECTKSAGRSLLCPKDISLPTLDGHIKQSVEDRLKWMHGDLIDFFLNRPMDDFVTWLDNQIQIAFSDTDKVLLLTVFAHGLLEIKLNRDQAACKIEDPCGPDEDDIKIERVN